MEENYPEEVFEAVKELLPQIENDLRREIYDQLIVEYQQKLEDEIAKTKEDVLIMLSSKHLQIQAQKDLEAIFEEIQQQTFKTFQEKLDSLEEKEKGIEADKQELEFQIRKQVEEQLRKEYEVEKAQLAQQVLEEFNTQVIGGEIEEKLKERLKEEMDEEIKQELDKKEKQIKISFKKKLEQERKLLTEGFEVEWKQKIDSEKKLLEKEKSEIARLKSLQNLRLKKLEDEKKQFKSQMKEQETKYSEIVNSLQKQISELEMELSQKTCQKEELEKSISIKSTVNGNETTSQQKLLKSSQRVKQTSKDDKELMISPVYLHKPLKEIETNYGNSSAFGDRTNPLSPPQDTDIININDILYKQTSITQKEKQEETKQQQKYNSQQQQQKSQQEEEEKSKIYQLQCYLQLSQIKILHHHFCQDIKKSLISFLQDQQKQLVRKQKIKKIILNVQMSNCSNSLISLINTLKSQKKIRILIRMKNNLLIMNKYSESTIWITRRIKK